MSATLADFCLRPDETNFSSPTLSPAKAYSRSKREAAPSKQRRAAPVYADVVDVLATDAAGHKYGRRRSDDGAMCFRCPSRRWRAAPTPSLPRRYLGDFADDCLTREGWGMLVSLNGDTYHGEFRDGKPNGYGEMRYASGASHRGLWERGERNGSGVFVDVDGSVIETLWKGDLPETAE